MRIKSDFRDYYDGLATYDEDRATLFLRKNERLFQEVECLKGIRFEGRDPNTRNEWWAYENILGFAGTLYPFIRVSHRSGDSPDKIYYDYDVYRESNPRQWKWGEDPIKLLFEINSDDKIKEDLFSRYGAIFIIRPPHYHPTEWKERNTLEIEKNPKLETLGFPKILNSALAYNSLRNWIHNQARPEKPIPEISNDDKIVLAGFNTKTSFRKDKS